MRPSLRNTTSYDIAREAGVSQSTVSRTFRGDPRVAPSTAERVFEIAKRLGYAPNAQARSLVTRRTHIVAVVVADITTPFYLQMVEELHAQLSRAGYRMILFNERTQGRGHQSLETLVNSAGADGVIFLSATIGSEAADLLISAGIPSVLLNRDAGGAVVDRVLADHRGGAAAVADHLLALGHRRIALIAGPTNTSTSRDREAGFSARLEQSDTPFDPSLRRSGQFTYDSGFQWCAELLRSPNPPTAIFCANDIIAFGALDAARKFQVPVPHQISIVGFGDVPMASWGAFSLTTVHQPLVRMATNASQILISRIEGSDSVPTRRIVFPTHLVIRSTTAVAPASK